MIYSTENLYGRANRHYIPGYLWHITHGCHQKEFLLKFAGDRRRWIGRLFEAKKSLGFKAKGRSIAGSNDLYQLRENVSNFGSMSLHGPEPAKSSDTAMSNRFCWKEINSTAHFHIRMGCLSSI